MRNRNTITLNGQESTEVEGLLIQELPPISKPQMRVETEEIDGRDGDIVTPLGYSAYDKEVLIGLFGDFEIDDIIAYFNSEGTVTFSNEPDKYYNYQIIEQIDFERLLRYRTATVKLHVQPFKYSTEELAKTFTPNLMSMAGYYTETKNGATVTSSNGTITIKGTATSASEFYVPITTLNLSAGSYTLTATTSGTNPDQAAIRLIHDSPSNANSFGGAPVYLTSGAATLGATISDTASYNYVWVYVMAGETLNISLTVSVTDNDEAGNFTINNNGNIFSKPLLTLTGSGTVNLSLNGNQVFVINFGEDINFLTIDTAHMEAYQETTNVLMNRYVDGDYNNFKLNTGKNTISWSGNLTQIVVENYSRWL